MCHYIDTSRFEVIKEFNYPGPRGISVHKEHTVYLRDAYQCSEEQKKDIYALPFCDNQIFETTLFSGEYDVLVYSVLMNYTQDIFVNRTTGVAIAYGGYTHNKDEAIETLPWKGNEKESFEGKYVFIGQQTAKDFEQDLQWLCSIVKKPIIFINGAEQDTNNHQEEWAQERHITMNKELDKFVELHKDRCQLLDVRTIVKDTTDLKDNIRHYQRPVYVKMAEELMTLLEGQVIKVERSRIIKERMKTVLSRIKKLLR